MGEGADHFIVTSCFFLIFDSVDRQWNSIFVMHNSDDNEQIVISNIITEILMNLYFYLPTLLLYEHICEK